jgi:Protein of unknown function (DUF742)
MNAGAGPGPLIRPYALTEGRTEPSRADLAIEDLVGTDPTAGRLGPQLSEEHHAIAQLCQEIVSVAEVAARLELPLGVARILVGDLADRGFVTIYRAPSPKGAPRIALLEQILQGLQQL